MNTVLAVPHASALGLVRAVISLFKLRIGTLIAITALVGFVVTPGGDASAMQALVLTLGTLMASASAGALNQYHEYASARLMLRTRNRAFVHGLLTRHLARLLLFELIQVAGVGRVWLLLLEERCVGHM